MMGVAWNGLSKYLSYREGQVLNSLSTVGMYCMEGPGLKGLSTFGLTFHTCTCRL